MKREPGTDELIHAYLDGELTDADAERLVARLREEPAKAQELNELERVAEAATRLPAPPLPPGFAERTLARALSAPPPRRPWRERLGRRIQLEVGLWQLAGATAALAVLVGAAGTLGFLRGEEAAEEALTERSAPPVPVGPAVARAAARPVRFVLPASDAAAVEIAGDFNGWVPAPLVRRPDGLFEAVVPLPPGRYEYAFCVDGSWQPDPGAERTIDDGFGGRNSVIEL